MKLRIKSIANYKNIDILGIINYLIFIVSLFNAITLMIWTVYILIYNIKKYSIEGCLYTLLLIQIRSILNPGLAIPYTGSSGILKWLVVFLCTFIILYYNRGVFKKKKIFILNGIFSIFIIFVTISSFINSSYPVTALFKIIAYYVPFISIIIGIYNMQNNNFSYTINKYLSVFVFFSLILLVSPIGYLRNGIYFQGFANHPNLFAIIIPLFLANYLYLNYDKFNLVIIIKIIVSFFILTRTQSRTGMISFCVIFILYLYNLRMKLNKKTLLLSLLILSSLTIYVFYSDSINKNIVDYLYKGHDSVTESREDQQENNLIRFYTHSLCGTGFNVPYDENIKDYSLSFDLVVENGNIVISLLGDTGIIGLILFIFSYGYIFIKGEGVLLFIAPLLVCMGEMTFFSTNNLGILLYFFYGIYFKGRDKIC